MAARSSSVRRATSSSSDARAAASSSFFSDSALAAAWIASCVGHELLADERLAHVIDRAELEPAHPARRVGEHGHEQDGDVARRRIFLEPAADLEAGEARHHGVEQDEIGRLAPDLPQRHLPVDGHGEGDRLAREGLGEQLEAAGVVIHQQDERVAVRRHGESRCQRAVGCVKRFAALPACPRLTPSVGSA
ncbi:hypothetical protein BE20_20190 [Sorangium cellulosum]|nr:hypothetical protein BE20_20190 [Sorangium cellulosum]